VWIGFCSEEVLPSPNDQAQAVGEFDDASTNWTERGADPTVLLARNAVAGAVTVLLTVI
jgi:hypothetical protein